MKEIGAAGTAWVPTPSWRNSVPEFPSRMIKVVLAAVAAGGAHLERLLHTVGQPYLPTKPSDLRLFPSIVNGTRFASTLRTLYLLIAIPKAHDLTWADDLGAFIRSFKNLEELSLTFDNWLNTEFLKTLVGGLRLQKLRILHIGDVAGDEEGLIQAISSHRRSVRC
ncbi:hypothetical protein BJX62DRAFT_3190 [Aspergillus germanicus]